MKRARRLALQPKWTRGVTLTRGPYVKVEDAVLLPILRSFVDDRPTYGYRRIAAVVNRGSWRGWGYPAPNCKRVHRIMHRNALLLERIPAGV
jgi:hypothetical protein